MPPTAMLNECFNPRTHTGCDSPVRTWLLYPSSFNPRTHTGCDRCTGLLRCNRRVSIHAPTRGATVTHHYVHISGCVSIHAPTRGATGRGGRVRWSPCCFNPRTHTGCDTIWRTISKSKKRFQSTHPHGVRQSSMPIACGGGRFQSTHPHGVRRTLSDIGLAVMVFQSTHPHGVRRRTSQARSARGCFNPRTHTGCDPIILSSSSVIPVGFNPRTHTGCDCCIAADERTKCCFNPRTHTGCDCISIMLLRISQ